MIDNLFQFGIERFDPSLSDVHCNLKVERLKAGDVEVTKNDVSLDGKETLFRWE